MSRESFGTDREGRNVEKLTLRRDGLEAEIITFGAALREAGIAYAIDQISDLIAGGVEGIHLYTMNNPEVAKQIAGSISSIRAV